VAKVKNDPKKYVRRSDLAPRRKAGKGGRVRDVKGGMATAFLRAPIDGNFYIDFRPVRDDERK